MFPGDGTTEEYPELGSSFEQEIERRLELGIRAGKYTNVHAVLLSDQNNVRFERYFTAIDARWGDVLGEVTFTSKTLHDLRSMSKSVVGLLYGIALSDGIVPTLEEPLLSALPKYKDLTNKNLLRITAADVLTMQLGFEWDESLPYSDARNSEISMERLTDRCRYVLERPIVHEPGKHWEYSGGGTALLACMLEEASGSSLMEYARSKLFSPLGIDTVEWVQGADGKEIAASGLRLRPRDMVKFGRLILNKGRHHGKQIVPKDWIEASIEPHANVDADLGYGYHWWVAKHWNWCAAFGTVANE